MIKVVKVLTLLAFFAIAAGCTTTRTSSVYHGVKMEDGETPICTIEIENTGWFLFDVVPLVCGDPRFPNDWSCRFFRDTIKLSNNLKVLQREMEKYGTCRIANVNSENKDNFYFFFLLFRRACHTSAVLLKEKD